MLYSELDKQKTARSAPAAVPQASSHRSLQASQHSNTPISKGAAHLLHSSTLPAAARAAIEWLLRIRQAQRRGGHSQASRELWIFQKKGELLDNDVIVSQFVPPTIVCGLTWTAFQLSKADDRILDCCEYFKNDVHVFGKKHNVILWTDDKNLALQVRVWGCIFVGLCVVLMIFCFC